MGKGKGLLCFGVWSEVVEVIRHFKS